MNAARAYARATSETASKERLMVLLFEAALRHMRVAAGHLDAKNVIEALPLLTKASDIVTELAATLNPQAAPELSQTLGVPLRRRAPGCRRGVEGRARGA
jgi:flagellar protein FliS